jgi:hypothetical protein
MKDDVVAPTLMRFFDQLSDADRESLVELLREPRTYLAEDMTDVLAILQVLDT